jgi:hypothetical protein
MNIQEIPPELQIQLAQAHDLLRGSNLKHLPLTARRGLWFALGSYQPVQCDLLPLATPHLRRVTLSNFSVTAVLPIWKQSIPNHAHVISEPFRQVEGYLLGKTSSDGLLAVLQDLIAVSDDFPPLPNKMVSYIPKAVAAFLGTVLQDEYGISESHRHYIDELSIEGIDSPFVDSSYLASLVFANGFPWDPKANRVRREQYWSWYLNEAVPAAWHVTAPIHQQPTR